MSSQGNWYSAMVRLVVVVTKESGDEPVHVDRSLFMFKSNSWEEAEERAFQLGLSMEDATINGFGQPVEYRFARVETLDQLDVDLTETGCEVWADIVEVSEPEDLVRNHPSDLKPGSSGVIPGDPRDD